MEILLVLALPLAGGVILALVGHRRYAAEVNSLFSFLTLAAAVRLAVLVVDRGSFVAMDELFFVDPFNVFLVALTAFVSFTTTLFSRPYMRNEAAKGKLSPNMMRLYHSMFQVFGFTMLLALLTNNIGILWVAMEAATLATVLLVSLYRTPASLKRRGSISFCAASALRRRCSGRYSCTSLPSVCSAAAAMRSCGRTFTA